MEPIKTKTMKNLQLSLKKEWFEMTKAGIKTEDYREITPYWCKRLLYITDGGIFDWENYFKKENESDKLLSIGANNGYFSYKIFKQNIMTLGYPKSTDTERILKYKHLGIEIGTGNPDWGAEPGKMYFVIKHG